MFSTRLPRAVVLALLVIAPALVAQESQKYLLPPQNIIDVFDAEPPAQISVSPNKQQIALIKARAYPTIAELSQPIVPARRRAHQSEDQRPASRVGPAGHRHQFDRAQEN
jgi:hypothetical protein